MNESPPFWRIPEFGSDLCMIHLNIFRCWQRSCSLGRSQPWPSNTPVSPRILARQATLTSFPACAGCTKFCQGCVRVTRPFNMKEMVGLWLGCGNDWVTMGKPGHVQLKLWKGLQGTGCGSPSVSWQERKICSVEQWKKCWFTCCFLSCSCYFSQVCIYIRDSEFCEGGTLSITNAWETDSQMVFKSKMCSAWYVGWGTTRIPMRQHRPRSKCTRKDEGILPLFSANKTALWHLLQAIKGMTLTAAKQYLQDVCDKKRCTSSEYFQINLRQSDTMQSKLVA